MLSTNAAKLPVSNHRFMSLVECEALERVLKDELLSLPHYDQATRQQKKDIQQGRNKAPQTLARLLVGAFRKDPKRPTRLARTIIGFFESKEAKEQRSLRDLQKIETREEGELNNVQIAIAQGDLSTPTLMDGVREIDEYLPVLQEMRSALLSEATRAR